jgi:hypothetical protein
MKIKSITCGFCSKEMRVVQGHPPLICICVQFIIDDYANELSSFVMFNRLTGELMSPVEEIDLGVAAVLAKEPPQIPFTEAHAQKIESEARKAAAKYLPNA